MWWSGRGLACVRCNSRPSVYATRSRFFIIRAHRRRKARVRCEAQRRSHGIRRDLDVHELATSERLTGKAEDMLTPRHLGIGPTRSTRRYFPLSLRAGRILIGAHWVQVRQLGLCTALSQKLAEGTLSIVDSLEIESLRTKHLYERLEERNWQRDSLFIDFPACNNENFQIASSNIELVGSLSFRVGISYFANCRSSLCHHPGQTC